MARADLLISLVNAGSSGDTKLFQRTVEALIAEERSKQHHVLAERLEESLKSRSVVKETTSFINDGIRDLLYEQTPYKPLRELILNEIVLEACHELVEEQHRAELLQSYGLEPRNRILLIGPPGNGKTSLAESIATELMVPLFSVRYEGVIGSYLGETATRLKKVFDFIKTQRCVVFFDEFDAIGKERGDQQETGEIKRVVSSLLLQIDSLPSYVVVVTATNHPELLDRAVWRRFQLRLDLPKPEKSQIEKWFKSFQIKFDQSLGYSPKILSEKMYGLSFAEIEQFTLDIQRRYVLSLPNSNLKTIIRDRLKQWEARYEVKSNELE
ncbi:MULTISPECIES: AAA family ATPase [Paenibacillus]|uniref:AAA family ATPase n=1 Tax=Paenibacillus TaxID=44249 RepID=UPI00129BB2FD|nr:MULTISPECIES: ATP-binding protein [Paenibacillus]KAE8561048.1 AAA family ATPase [Paenibacillus polymyxa]KAF6584727.1 AAA family ATPase [Paenibacillus sp. EKM211P]MCJ1220510.1 ATP-binding protein [Paenibacillus polymyxa]